MQKHMRKATIQNKCGHEEQMGFDLKGTERKSVIKEHA